MTVERVDVAWAAFFGLSPQAFLEPGIQVVAHRQLGNYRGVWLFRHHAALCLSAPPDLVRDLQAAVRAFTVQSLFSEAGVRALLGPRVAELIGPVYQGYVERPSFRPVMHPAVRALFAADTAALRQLATACDADAWEHSGITLDDPRLFGLIVDGLVVAAARCRPGWGETAHVGVVTHPDHRGRGYGRAVVSATTAQALAEGFVVLYQTALANRPSVALATGLGYREYATHLAVRLAGER